MHLLPFPWDNSIFQTSVSFFRVFLYMFDSNKVIVGLLWLALCYLGLPGAHPGCLARYEVYFLVGSVGWMPISGSITNFRTKTTIFPVRCLNPSFLLLKSPVHRPNQQSTAQSALSERPQRAAHMLPGVWGCGTGVIREEQTLPGTSGTSGDDRKKNWGIKWLTLPSGSKDSCPLNMTISRLHVNLKFGMG
jgi:hypothetical protein